MSQYPLHNLYYSGFSWKTAGAVHYLSSCSFLFSQPVVCDSPETSGACLDVGINCTNLKWCSDAPAWHLFVHDMGSPAQLEQSLGLKAAPVGAAFYVASEAMVAVSAEM